MFRRLCARLLVRRCIGTTAVRCTASGAVSRSPPHEPPPPQQQQQQQHPHHPHHAAFRPVIDFKNMLEQIEVHRENARRRKIAVDFDRIQQLHEERRTLVRTLDGLRAQRNALSQQVGRLARTTSVSQEQPSRDDLLTQLRDLKARIAQLEAQESDLDRTLLEEGSRVPNLSHPDVPIGDETQARCVYSSSGGRGSIGGPAAADPGTAVRSHLELLAGLDAVDFEAAAATTASKFYYLKRSAALLELALVQWAVSRAVQRGFVPVAPPDLARPDVVAACGFNPRGAGEDPLSQAYLLEGGQLALIATQEITLAGLAAGREYAAAELPLRLVGFGHCFRREAGAQGQFSKGLYRVHQFTKVELFAVTAPEHSEAMHAELVDLQRALYTELGLPFRVLDMPTEELGAPAARKYDVEAWMPGRQGYGEICSASNCTDYQARRLGIRVRGPSGAASQFAHTLNGTACAVPRVIIALLENNQLPDGSVRVPAALQPLLGTDVLRPVPRRPQA